jgi:hypothetical protein
VRVGWREDVCCLIPLPREVVGYYGVEVEDKGP